MCQDALEQSIEEKKIISHESKYYNEILSLISLCRNIRATNLYLVVLVVLHSGASPKCKNTPHTQQRARDEAETRCRYRN